MTAVTTENRLDRYVDPIRRFLNAETVHEPGCSCELELLGRIPKFKEQIQTSKLLTIGIAHVTRFVPFAQKSLIAQALAMYQQPDQPALVHPYAREVLRQLCEVARCIHVASGVNHPEVTEYVTMLAEAMQELKW